ncbi:MAG: hypothetical protein AVDCRST_MAG33-2148 [uncultured Thermomicrobiales bacterium]|uniref:Uncharacterized protein n=1 Tax=uncultured Thermomicrobiales bacterium TaxID=1645740 RepID=A0A6J4V3E0_9BACT|nr:MAG: hypothetical protein AVDCRST_MAG33-2148 [uncultured Thermomicrobiales bacterium]
MPASAMAINERLARWRSERRGFGCDRQLPDEQNRAQPVRDQTPILR